MAEQTSTLSFTVFGDTHPELAAEAAAVAVAFYDGTPYRIVRFDVAVDHAERAAGRRTILRHWYAEVTCAAALPLPLPPHRPGEFDAVHVDLSGGPV
jgi:hypothetical protein